MLDIREHGGIFGGSGNIGKEFTFDELGFYSPPKDIFTYAPTSAVNSTVSFMDSFNNILCMATLSNQVNVYKILYIEENRSWNLNYISKMFNLGTVIHTVNDKFFIMRNNFGLMIYKMLDLTPTIVDGKTDGTLDFNAQITTAAGEGVYLFDDMLYFFSGNNSLYRYAIDGDEFIRVDVTTLEHPTQNYNTPGKFLDRENRIVYYQSSQRLIKLDLITMESTDLGNATALYTFQRTVKLGDFIYHVDDANTVSKYGLDSTTPLMSVSIDIRRTDFIRPINGNTLLVNRDNFINARDLSVRQASFGVNGANYTTPQTNRWVDRLGAMLDFRSQTTPYELSLIRWKIIKE